jgi:hypothetical protein
LLVSLVLAVIGVLSWAGISREPLRESWPGGLCVAALVVGYSGYSFVRGLQFGAGQVPRATAWDVTSVVIGLAGLLVLLAAGVRSTALLLPLALAYAVYTVAGWPVQRTAHVRPRREGLRSPAGADGDDGTAVGGLRGDAAGTTGPTSPGLVTPGSSGRAQTAGSATSAAPDLSRGAPDGAPSVDLPVPWRALRHEIDHFVLFGLAGAVAVTGFLQLSMVVSRLVDTKADAGQYAAALSLATPASLLAGSLSLVLFPSMAEAWGRGDRDGFRRQGDHAMRLLVLLMVGVFGALVLVSRPLVRAVFGADFAQAQHLLPWLLFAVMAISIGVGAVTSLTTRSQQGVVLSSAASAAGLVVGGIVWAVIAPDHGVRGVAVGYLVGTVVGTAVPVAVAWRQDAQRWAGLALRTAVGVALVLVLLWVERRYGASPFGSASSSDAVVSSQGSAAYSSTVTLVLSDGPRASAWLLDPLCALGFLVAWLLVSWRDARRLLPSLLRRR